MFFALRDVVEYLNDSGVITVILGGGQDISIGVAGSFRDDKRFVLSVVDSRADVKTGREATGSSNFISRILSDNPQLFHLQLIGIQNHLVPALILEKLHSQTFDYIRLGQIRDDFSALEPLMRNTTFLSFDMSSVRNADGGGSYHLNPNGLHGEEACRIAHYAGLSHKIRAFGLFEMNPEYDNREMTANLSAQMVWYFLEALDHRLTEDPATDPTAFIKYFVDMEGDPLVFYNHRASGRWWIEITSGEKENYLIPCLENDYLTASRKEIPDIWWKFARKTDRISK
jgi:arginase family enzyme